MVEALPDAQGTHCSHLLLSNYLALVHHGLDICRRLKRTHYWVASRFFSQQRRLGTGQLTLLLATKRVSKTEVSPLGCHFAPQSTLLNIPQFGSEFAGDPYTVVIMRLSLALLSLNPLDTLATALG